MTLSEMIKEECKNKGISQSELARRIGTSKQNLYKKLKANTIGDKDIEEIEKALNVTLVQYFEDNDKKKKSRAEKVNKKNDNPDKTEVLNKEKILKIFTGDYSDFEKDIKEISKSNDFSIFMLVKHLESIGENEKALELCDLALKEKNDDILSVYLYLMNSLLNAKLTNHDISKKCYKSAKTIATSIGVESILAEYKKTIQDTIRQNNIKAKLQGYKKFFWLNCN